MHVAEDVDLVLRLHAAGWRLRYEPASRVAHDHRTDLRAWWLRKAYYGTGAAPLALRHRGAVPPMVLSPWAAAVAGALLARRPLAAVGVAAWAVQRLVPQLPELSRPWLAAARIIGLGAVGAVAQTADAVNRHYWPLAALACAVSRAGPPDRRGRRAGRRRRRLACATATATPRCGRACSATSSRTGSTTSPTAPGCGGAPCATARSSRCARRARGSRGRAATPDTLREYCVERVN